MPFFLSVDQTIVDTIFLNTGAAVIAARGVLVAATDGCILAARGVLLATADAAAIAAGRVLVAATDGRVVIAAGRQEDYRAQLEEELTELRQSEMWQAGAAVRNLRPSAN